MPLPLLLPGDTLLIATHNQGKLREIAEIVTNLGVFVASAGEKAIPEPEETGNSFRANAELKAEHAAALAKDCKVLADDSGLEVDALDGAPGIYSARWAGAAKDFTIAMEKIRQELQAKGLEPEGQKARFVCALSLAAEGHQTQTFIGTVEGRLTFPPRGSKGFGYDPVFIPDGYDCTFAEMEPVAKHRISHRANAFHLLMDYLEAGVDIASSQHKAIL